MLLGLLVLAGLAAAVLVGLPALRDDGGKADRRAAAQRYATAWAARDTAAMWRALDPASRQATPERAFRAAYANAEKEVGVKGVRVGRLGEERDGTIRLKVRERTARFGTLTATTRLQVSGEAAAAGVRWNPALRLAGLREGERPRVRIGEQPTRGRLLSADGRQLDADPLGASIAGVPASGGKRATGLERVHDDRLSGTPSQTLRFGRRTIARVKVRRGRSVTTTIKPGLQRAAAAALGDRLGGVAVIRPRDGAVQALAGLAVSAPQPPGSTFKIITLAAALRLGVATPASNYPVRTAATLSGRRLANASNEQCGGTLAESFAESCNSVFAPLGAKIGARRLVAAAESFGFDQELPRIPALKASTIPTDLPDSLAVGASAIGQGRVLATPLQMVSVAATIANGGRRVAPRLATVDPLKRNRVVSAKVAGQVRSMMIKAVGEGTGQAAALPGVQVAGKTGTAELKAGSDDPKDANAWFVAFAPAGEPQVAVAVLVVGGGFGGTTAAPIAKKVLQAALQ